ncbi:GPI mannosyltransferase 4 [Culicoides brevitarsis]|uniref:GPI mannosyltransferase 4 n=1 Tax=Culicoides brevitarsis TaxID=469753 RepID=UPI00307BC36D
MPNRMKKSHIKSLIYQGNDLVHYFFFALLRIVLVFIPQFGYIHPDEFFQTIEVMAADEFQIDAIRTWEYNRTFPIRSAAIPFIYLRVPLNIYNLLSRYLYYYFSLDMKCSYWLLVFPRMIMCAISFVNDYCLYRICLTYGLEYHTSLLALGSSYVMLVYGTRTFSNTIEMALCSLLLWMVSECIIHSKTVIYQKEFLDKKYETAKSVVERVKFFKMRSRLPAHSFNKCFFIATICVLGVFNRPTFLVFGFPIVFQWLQRGMGTKTVTFVDFNFRILFLILASLPALLYCIITDSFYFKYLTISELEHRDVGINNFVVTPLNFLRYNLNPAKTAEHGEHPKWVHVLVNLPLLYNVLGITTVVSFCYMIYRFGNQEYQFLPRAQSFVGLMICSIVTPVLALSFINHQEARFLIPITLPVVMLHAPKLRYGFTNENPFKVRYWLYDYFYKYVLAADVSSKYLLKIWYILNLCLTIFFGFLHQGGVYPLADHFSMAMVTKAKDTHLHLITSHIYDIPNYLLYLPSTTRLHVNPDTGHKYRKSQQFFLHEHGSMDLREVFNKIKLLVDVNEMKKVTTNKSHKYKIYFAIPTSKLEEWNYVFYNGSAPLTQQKIKIFYPHLSTEALPDFYSPHPHDIGAEVTEKPLDLYTIDGALKQFSSIVHQFGLILYKIEVKSTSKRKNL